MAAVINQYIEKLLDIVNGILYIQVGGFIMRKSIFIIMFILLQNNIFGLNIYLYNGYEDFIILKNVESINTYNDIIVFLEQRYSSQRLKIETTEIVVSDEFDQMIILDINIILDLEIWEIYNGSGHSAPILEEVFINLLQPEILRNEYNIYGIIIKLNNTFLDNINYDMIYEPMITKRMYADIFNTRNQ